ncbi:hypothetical protein H4R26_005026 [Coemansia thaxteri]|uniref:AN1-type domain-containing protein n=1 Tax=Coemansia thaxteri TaxID=2663907 RepID=A0A9W8EDG1_9FUNG|nr:hypothetical protein H4R26_005026 [Coemansia thaxteri]
MVDQHNCSRKDLVVDRRVPDCPLCGEVVSIGPGENPNDVVNRHITDACSSNPSARNPLPKSTAKSNNGSSNGCALRRCKDKVIVFAECPYCHLKFCMKHRFEGDHECTKRSASAPPASSGFGSLVNTSVLTSRLGPLLGGHSASPSAPSARSRKPSQPAAKPKDTGCIIA